MRETGWFSFQILLDKRYGRESVDVYMCAREKPSLFEFAYVCCVRFSHVSFFLSFKRVYIVFSVVNCHHVTWFTFSPSIFEHLFSCFPLKM